MIRRWPAHLERRLAARLKRRVHVVRTVILEQIQAVARHDGARADSVLGLSAMGPRIRLAVRAAQPVTASSLIPVATGIDAAVTAAVASDLGASASSLAPATQSAIRAWAQTTAERIHAAEDALIDRALAAAQAAQAAGGDPLTAARDALDSAEVRAALLARDAVGDLVAPVTATRAQQLGSDRFQWHTQHDARVRPAHAALEGTVWAWTSPPAEGLPGDPPACRCWAEPIPVGAVAPAPPVPPVAPAPPVPAPPAPPVLAPPAPNLLRGARAVDLFGGASEAEAAKILARALGQPFSPNDVARWAGLQGLSGLRVSLRLDGPNRVALSILGPGLNLERSYSLRPSGLYAYHEFFQVGERGQGLGREIFAQQVAALRQAGFTGIGTKAAGGPGQPLVGYYVWPRLGFDGTLPASVRSSLPPELAGAARISDLMATPLGRDWWRAQGVPLEVEFSLAAGSLSSQIFDAYLESAGLRLDAGDRVEEAAPLSAHEEAILDRVWARVRR